MTARTTFVDWWKSLPIPWLISGPNGQKEAWPGVVDDQVTLLDAARKVAFADYAPVDALVHLGADRQFIQGPNESNASFQTRIKAAFDEWPRAGSACGVLEQLEYYGLRGCYWVQQNGLQYTLSAAPTPGVDPTSLVVASNTSATTTTLTSTILPHRTIPAGTPWFAFDGNTDLTNRFAIIAPSWPFSSLATAVFNNSDTATVTWPVPFANTSYSVIIGPPSDNVVLSASGLTTTGATINASAPWTGSVQVIAYAAGVNPLNVFSSASAGAIKALISSFKSNSICMGLFAIMAGEMWDFPSGLTWNGDSNLWDASVVTQILGSF